MKNICITYRDGQDSGIVMCNLVMEVYSDSESDEENNKPTALKEERIKVDNKSFDEKTSNLPRSKLKDHCVRVIMVDGKANQEGNPTLVCSYCSRKIVHNGTNGIKNHLSNHIPKSVKS